MGAVSKMTLGGVSLGPLSTAEPATALAAGGRWLQVSGLRMDPPDAFSLPQAPEQGSQSRSTHRSSSTQGCWCPWHGALFPELNPGPLLLPSLTVPEGIVSPPPTALGGLHS